MDDREWMYSRRSSFGQWTDEWIKKTDAFLETVFRSAKGARKVWCPCSSCENGLRQTKTDMGKHLCKYGFMLGYIRWTLHGEADRMRDEVVTQHVVEFEDEGGVADMLDDFHDGNLGEGRRQDEEELEATAKAYYDMLDAAQKPLYEHTNVSQLDAIGRLMDLKSQLNMSRAGFDVMLTVFGSILPKDHILPKNMYESQKMLRALKMPYEPIHACEC